MPVREFAGPYAALDAGGNGWRRASRGIGREFNVVRHQEGKDNSVTSIELRGFNKNPKQATISARVRKAHKGKPCVFHPVAFPSGLVLKD